MKRRPRRTPGLGVVTSLSLFPLQVKVMTEQDLLAVACEQFLGKSVMEIKAVVLQTLEGHLRSILGIDLRLISTVCLSSWDT